MVPKKTDAVRLLVAALIPMLLMLSGCASSTVELEQSQSSSAEEVVFWHFWGGKDSVVVDSIVQQFNNSQQQYRVRAIAMPGNNLQAKLFLAVAGGDPPDLVNQDDPVLADWARRGVISPMSNFADADEIKSLRANLFPAAERLSVVDDQLFGLCNGLDIRALFYNASALEVAGLPVPKSIEQLDAVAEHFAAPGSQTLTSPVGYLPDSRRLWAWGPVFGGSFYDSQARRAAIDHPGNRAALNWMRTYQRRYGADNLASFRQADQSLPGKTFPLLPIGDTDSVGRYVAMMDGQWRVRDIVAFQKQRTSLGKSAPKFGVCPLPYPDADGNGVPDKSARENAGWVNGNFFVVPSGARCPSGAWEFAKFWIGSKDSRRAAQWYVDGGWIPATQEVAATESFQEYLEATPLFKTFVDLAGSENQFPVPAVPGAAAFKREVESLAWDALMLPMDDQQLNRRIEQCQRDVDAYLGGDR